MKPTYCCPACKKLAEKYNYENKIFTFDNNKIVSAVIDDPTISLALMIKYDLKYD